MNRYTTPLSAVKNPGWAKVGLLWTTCTPLRDENTGGFAHLTYATALEAAHLVGGRLPTRGEIIRLHEADTLGLKPCFLPTTTMLRGAGIDPKDTATASKFRDANMSSRSWAEIHDSEMLARLKAAGWDGTSSATNIGKLWAAGAAPGKGRICGWWIDGVLVQLGYVDQHNDGHHDYGTLTGVVSDAAPCSPHE